MKKIQSLLLVLSTIWAGSVQAQELKGKEKKSVKRLKSNIAYLASDMLAGRATGTPGEKQSAEFIAAEFEKLKLEPKGENGYFQTFTITTLRLANKSTELVFNGEPLILFNDFYPLSYSANKGEVSTEMVAVGFGISSKDRDDYDGKDVKGKVALINLGSPDGIHPHSKFLAWHGINIRVDEAVKHGAVGVIFYRENDKVKKPEGDLSLTMTPSSVPVFFYNRMMPMEEMNGMTYVRYKLNILTDEDTGYNVIGFNDNGAETTVVIGAHHDHLGTGQHGNSLAENANQIHNGADDNASGTAALLEIARAVKRSKKWNKKNNYLFIAFSGEEMGLLGSKHFVENPTINLKTVNYMINMDMIGMLNEEKVLIINGVGTSPAFNTSIDEVYPVKGIQSVKKTMSGVGASDHTPFYLKGIPALHFFTGAHPHYHKPTDDIERLNYEGEVFVIGYIVAMIRSLNDDGRLAYTKTKDEGSSNGKSRSKFAVTLGVIPNYTFEGEGMQVDAVRDGKPGKKAGLQAKDVIVSFAGMSISGMGDYMKALQTLKPGDKAEVTVMRKGELVKLNVQF